MDDEAHTASPTINTLKTHAVVQQLGATAQIWLRHTVGRNVQDLVQEIDVCSAVSGNMERPIHSLSAGVQSFGVPLRFPVYKTLDLTPGSTVLFRRHMPIEPVIDSVPPGAQEVRNLEQLWGTDGLCLQSRSNSAPIGRPWHLQGMGSLKEQCARLAKVRHNDACPASTYAGHKALACSLCLVADALAAYNSCNVLLLSASDGHFADTTVHCTEPSADLRAFIVTSFFFRPSKKYVLFFFPRAICL